MEKVFKKGLFLGTVDREFENDELNPIIVATLPCGFQRSFKKANMPDVWYIKQAEESKSKRYGK